MSETEVSTPQPPTEAAVSVPAPVVAVPLRGGFGGVTTGHVPSEEEKAEMARINAVLSGRA